MPMLIVRQDGQELRRYPVVRDQTFLGRDPTCDIVLASDTVSRRHARIEYANGNFTLYSTSGTKPLLVANREVRFAPLADATEFQLGDYTLIFVVDGGPAPETLERVYAERFYRPRKDKRRTTALSPQMLKALAEKDEET